MRRKLGSCTWIFGEEPLSVIATRVRRAGLDGVELFGDIDAVAPSEARDIFAAEGLEIFSITPADADISHPDPTVRQPAIAYYEGLMDFASAIGNPLVSCHGQVARIKPVSTQAEEDDLLRDAAHQICGFAQRRDLTVVFEILNRYETHQIRTVAEGLAFLDKVQADNLRLLPDAYHMNIEEADPFAALLAGGKHIGLYHAADSNRCGIGEGHTDFRQQIMALDEIGYDGPIILETSAPGPNPFTPDKGEDFQNIVEAQLARSVSRLRALGT
ncbi:MAG TPA: sugar phosphate isomerase/epimerase family protein [Hyphomicrobiales bacterium]|nr:sugar phosphate isomerase/epimerase family protein [Hyphomicrobiales bacterium]